MDIDYTVVSYLAYVAISLRVTVWVGRTLFENGRVFLVDATHGNEPLADSINQLVLVGFYLINVGYMSLMLQTGEPVLSVQASIELLSEKLGMVLLILGVMHLGNVYVFDRYRSAALEDADLPPVAPDGVVR